MEDLEARPAWDDGRAAQLIGSRVLIGITYAEPDGPRYEQMFGVIRSANGRGGFEVALEGSSDGRTYWLPPDLSNFHPAEPGEYRLRSTGEVVIDPDYTSEWTIEPPAR